MLLRGSRFLLLLLLEMLPSSHHRKGRVRLLSRGAKLGRKAEHLVPREIVLHGKVGEQRSQPTRRTRRLAPSLCGQHISQLRIDSGLLMRPFRRVPGWRLPWKITAFVSTTPTLQSLALAARAPAPTRAS